MVHFCFRLPLRRLDSGLKNLLEIIAKNEEFVKKKLRLPRFSFLCLIHAYTAEPQENTRQSRDDIRRTCAAMIYTPHGVMRYQACGFLYQRQSRCISSIPKELYLIGAKRRISSSRRRIHGRAAMIYAAHVRR